MKTVGVGNEFFHDFIENDSYYVDKTPFIRTVFKENPSKVMLITRPRRFGKTLTMSTFYDFLSLNPENPGDVSRQEKWFRDTEIFKDKEFCNKNMGKFPVVFLTFKSIAHQKFDDAYNQMAFVISSLAADFKYIKSSVNFTEEEMQSYLNLLDYDLLKDQTDKTCITNSLRTLIYLLYRHHGKRPILLIDEYDVPIAKAAHFGYYREMVDIMGPMLSNALKTNEYLERAVLTGCLRAAKESIFTGLNNFKICSVLDSGKNDLSRGIGFTDEETKEVLTYYGLADCYEEVKNNYDGYNFGKIHMYCPWDVMSFCDDNRENTEEDKKLISADNYWINTSGNDVIEEFMGFINPEDTDQMQALLDGKSITADVKPSLCYGDLRNHNINDFWTLLLYTGYLTFNPATVQNLETDAGIRCELYIPNKEITKCFKSKIMEYYENNTERKNYTADLIKALFAGNAEGIQNNLNNLLSKYVSVRDFSTRAPKENYYHGFMNGLLVNGASLVEEQQSNMESGDGYVDLIVASKDSETVAVLELKQTGKPFGARVTIAENALKQVSERGYAAEFMEDPLVKNIYACGICFYKKHCAVTCKKLK